MTLAPSHCGRAASCGDCQRGYFCPLQVNTEMKSCTTGSYCPYGAMPNPLSCPAGSYCPQPNMIVALICTAGLQSGTPFFLTFTGHYCSGGNVQPVLCAANTACPEGSSAELPCGALFYSNAGSVVCLRTFLARNFFLGL